MTLGAPRTTPKHYTTGKGSPLTNHTTPPTKTPAPERLLQQGFSGDTTHIWAPGLLTTPTTHTITHGTGLTQGTYLTTPLLTQPANPNEKQTITPHSEWLCNTQNISIFTSSTGAGAGAYHPVGWAGAGKVSPDGDQYYGIGGTHLEPLWETTPFHEPENNTTPKHLTTTTAGVLNLSVLPPAEEVLDTEQVYGLVSGRGVKFKPKPAVTGSEWDEFIGNLPTAAPAKYYPAGAASVPLPPAHKFVTSVDTSGVTTAGAGFSAVGVGIGGVENKILKEGISVPWLGSFPTPAEAAATISETTLENVPLHMVGVPTYMGVNEVGSMPTSWGVSAASIGYLSYYGEGAEMGRRLGVTGLGAGGFVPGVSGIAGSQDSHVPGLAEGFVKGQIVPPEVGAVVDVDGWLWRYLIYGSSLAPERYSTLAGTLDLTSEFGGAYGKRGIYGGGIWVSGNPAGTKIRALRKASSPEGVLALAEGIHGRMNIAGVPHAVERLMVLGRSAGWELLRNGLRATKESVSWHLLPLVTASIVEARKGTPGLGLGFTAGTEGGWESITGKGLVPVGDGSKSAGLFGRAGYGVSGGRHDVQAGSPILGLGVSTAEVAARVAE